MLSGEAGPIRQEFGSMPAMESPVAWDWDWKPVYSIPTPKPDVEVSRRNLESLRRESRLASAGFWPYQCKDCGRTIYLRGVFSTDMRAHRSWAHPVYKSRRESIQQTGRRPGNLPPLLERLAVGVEKWWGKR